GVDLHAEDGPGVFDEARGEAAGTAADLDGQVVARQLGGAEEQIEEVEVDEEVLTELVLGLDAAVAEEVLEEGKRLARLDGGPPTKGIHECRLSRASVDLYLTPPI